MDGRDRGTGRPLLPSGRAHEMRDVTFNASNHGPTWPIRIRLTTSGQPFPQLNALSNFVSQSSYSTWDRDPTDIYQPAGRSSQAAASTNVLEIPSEQSIKFRPGSDGISPASTNDAVIHAIECHLRNLSSTVREALELYSVELQAFEHQTQMLGNWADDKQRDNLWVLMMQRNEAFALEKANTLEKTIAEHLTMLMEITSGEFAASKGPQHYRMQHRVRTARKMLISGEGIRALMSKAFEERAACSELIHELGEMNASLDTIVYSVAHKGADVGGDEAFWTIRFAERALTSSEVVRSSLVEQHRRV